MKLKEYKLGEITTIKGGKRLPKNNELTDKITKHPYIRARDIKNGKIKFLEPKYLENETYEKIKNYIVHHKDIIITIVGANIGDVAFVNKNFNKANLTENAVRLSCDKNIIKPKYLLYYLSINESKQYFQLVASGAAQDKLGIYKIKKTSIFLPPLPIQEKIAEILSRYDDLIENNLKQIKLLEEIAQITYEEWFIRFRPNGKQLPINKETGLPNGWEKVKFEKVFNINNGYAFQSEIFQNSGIPLLRTRDYSQTKWINMNQPIYISNELSEKYKKYFIQDYDLMVIMVGASIGKFGIVLPKDKGALQNQNQWAIRTNKGFENYLFYKIIMMESLIQKLLTRKTGAARDFFRAGFLKELDITLPSKEIIIDLNKKIKPIYSEINNLMNQNQKLKEARDILLPRLMTGMIDLEDK